MTIERLLTHGDFWPEGHPHEGEPTPENRPQLIVVHAMAYQIDYEGERLYAASFLDAVGLSAHMLVAPDGTRIRCRRDDQMAWHAKGFNENSVGIEVLVPRVYEYSVFLQRIAEPWVDRRQLEATAEQVREWCAKWPIERIAGHHDLDPDRKQDPGRGFPWHRFMALIASEKAA